MREAAGVLARLAFFVVAWAGLAVHAALAVGKPVPRRHRQGVVERAKRWVDVLAVSGMVAVDGGGVG